MVFRLNMRIFDMAANHADAIGEFGGSGLDEKLQCTWLLKLGHFPNSSTATSTVQAILKRSI
jgi:hypothetical protein